MKYSCMKTWKPLVWWGNLNTPRCAASIYFFLRLLLLLLLGPFHFYVAHLHTALLFKTFTACWKSPTQTQFMVVFKEIGINVWHGSVQPYFYITDKLRNLANYLISTHSVTVTWCVIWQRTRLMLLWKHWRKFQNTFSRWSSAQDLSTPCNTKKQIMNVKYDSNREWHPAEYLGPTIENNSSS
jgi:hypothetical protein